MKAFAFKHNNFLVNFDPNNGQIKISGKATPIDPFTDYKSFITWFEDYLIAPPEMNKLIIDIDFFNSIFTKFLFRVFLMIENSGYKNNFVILWLYDDNELSELAEDLKNYVTIPFEKIKK